MRGKGSQPAQHPVSAYEWKGRRREGEREGKGRGRVVGKGRERRMEDLGEEVGEVGGDE